MKVTDTNHVKWLTVKDFAINHGFSENLIYRAVKKNKIPSARIGSKIVIPSNALAILADRKTE